MSSPDFITPEVVIGSVTVGLALIYFAKAIRREIIIRRAMNKVIKGYKAHVKHMERNKPQ